LLELTMIRHNSRLAAVSDTSRVCSQIHCVWPRKTNAADSAFKGLIVVVLTTTFSLVMSESLPPANDSSRERCHEKQGACATGTAPWLRLGNTQHGPVTPLPHPAAPPKYNCMLRQKANAEEEHALRRMHKQRAPVHQATVCVPPGIQLCRSRNSRAPVAAQRPG